MSYNDYILLITLLSLGFLVSVALCVKAILEYKKPPIIPYKCEKGLDWSNCEGWVSKNECEKCKEKS